MKVAFMFHTPPGDSPHSNRGAEVRSHIHHWALAFGQPPAFFRLTLSTARLDLDAPSAILHHILGPVSRRNIFTYQGIWLFTLTPGTLDLPDETRICAYLQEVS